MDTSNWTNLNNSIKIEHTKKLFFGKYLYKVAFEVNYARIIKDVKKYEDIEPRLISILSFQKEMDRLHLGFYKNSTMMSTRSNNPPDLKQLKWWYKTLKNNSGLQIRVESPRLCVYGNDINLLFDIAKKEPKSPLSLLAVSMPESDAIADSIVSGKVITKKIPKQYKYKIIFNYGFYNQYNPNGQRKQVLNYLESLGDEVKIPQFTVHALKHDWGAQSYVYCKDEQISTFITLICPKLISKIIELDYHGD